MEWCATCFELGLRISGDAIVLLGAFVLRKFCPENENLKEATFLGEKFRTEIFTWRRWRTTQATKAWSWQEVLICASFPSTGSNHCVQQGLVEDCPVSEGKVLRVMLSYFDSYGARNRWHASVFFPAYFVKYLYFRNAYVNWMPRAATTIALPALMSLRACLYSRSSAFFAYAVRFRCRSFSNSASLLRLSFETKGCITWVWDWPNLGDTSKIS